MKIRVKEAVESRTSSMILLILGDGKKAVSTLESVVNALMNALSEAITDAINVAIREWKTRPTRG